jgi:hypothetical protein
MHLTIDRKHTLDLIDTLLKYTEQHTRGFNRLQEIFDATIDEAFRRPTPFGGYYKYMNDNVRSFATSYWNKCLREHESDFIYSVDRSINDVTVLVKKPLVRFNDLLIGESDDDGELRLIENVMKKILNNRRILQAILSLLRNRRDLDYMLNQIAEELVQISNMIANGTYTTKAKCCPTLLRMLEDISF